jgi:hypothetical protein
MLPFLCALEPHARDFNIGFAPCACKHPPIETYDRRSRFDDHAPRQIDSYSTIER